MSVAISVKAQGRWLGLDYGKMLRGGVRIGLSLATVAGCLLILAADQSPQHYVPAPVPQYGGPELPMPMQPQGVQHVQNQQQLDVAVIAQRLAEHHQSESTAQTIYVYLLI